MHTSYNVWEQAEGHRILAVLLLGLSSSFDQVQDHSITRLAPGAYPQPPRLCAPAVLTFPPAPGAWPQRASCLSLSELGLFREIKNQTCLTQTSTNSLLFHASELQTNLNKFLQTKGEGLPPPLKHASHTSWQDHARKKSVFDCLYSCLVLLNRI